MYFLYANGFVLDFEKRKVEWNGISVPMSSNTKPRTFVRKEVSEIRPRTFVHKNRKTHNNNNTFFELYAFIILTSTLVLGINYFLIITRPLHPIPVRKRSSSS